MSESYKHKQERAVTIITLLRNATKNMEQPAAAHIVDRFGKDPFLILVSCILSLRTKDTVSLPASMRLFDHAQTPQALFELSEGAIQKSIYPVGFYRQKARQLRAISHMILDKFSEKVPCSEDELLRLPGVGLKTANLVRGEAFGIPSICVDTHVHRISNRLGLVKTKAPDQTEAALKELLPQEYWIEYNRLIVMWGQNVCVPISPFCSSCPLASVCPRRGVTRSR